MVNGTRTSLPSGWLDGVCPEPLRHQIVAAQAAGAVLEPLVVHWASSVAHIVSEVEAALGAATSTDDQFEALARVVGLNALTELAGRIGEACRQATESDCFD